MYLFLFFSVVYNFFSLVVGPELLESFQRFSTLFNMTANSQVKVMNIM